MSSEARYELKDRAATEATVQVTVPPEAVQKQIEAVYLRYGREVRVPGFRKGHVPRSYLDSRIGRDVFLEEARDDLQRQYLPNALKSLSLHPVSPGQVDVVSFGADEPFVFNATFAVLPEITLPDYRTVEVPVPVSPPITEEDVHRALEELRSQFGALGEKEGDTVADGDIVRVSENGQEWDVRAESGNPVTRELIGASVGAEVEIDTERSDGKPIQTRLTVLGLRQVILPEIDDELAKDAGVDNLNALKKQIESKLAEQRARQHQLLTDRLILETLIEKTSIPLPDVFVDELLQEEFDRLKGSSQQPGVSLTFEEYLEKRGISEEGLQEEIRDSIVSRLRRELILQELAKDLGVVIDEEELNRLAREDAETYDEKPLRFVARLKAEDRWDDYRLNKVNERVFEMLRSIVTVKEKEEVN